MRMALTDTQKLLSLSTRNFILGGIVAALICAAPVVSAYSDVPVTQTYNSADAQVLSALDGIASSSPIVITHDDIIRSDRNSINRRDVDTQAELVAYVRALMASDADIERTELGMHYVSMTYKSRVRVQYIGMHALEREVRISDDGTISVTKPWYALVADTDSDAVQSGFSDISLIAGSGGFSAETEALLVTRMHGRFQIGAL